MTTGAALALLTGGLVSASLCVACWLVPLHPYAWSDDVALAGIVDDDALLAATTLAALAAGSGALTAAGALLPGQRTRSQAALGGLGAAVALVAAVRLVGLLTQWRG